MFKIELTAEFDKLDLMKDREIRNVVRKELIENGLDDTLSNSIKFLKAHITETINTQVRYKKVIENYSDLEEDHNINIPKTQKDVIKELFDIDLDKVNPNMDYTKYGQTNAVLINSNRAILKMDESIFSDPAQSYEKATKFFQEAIFIDLSGPTPSYFYADPKFNVEKWVKAFCSRDTGLTDRTKHRFNKFQNKGESEWRIKQEGLKQLRKNSVDISSIVNLVLKGDYETAANALKSKPYSRLNYYIDQKIQKLQKGQSTTTDYAIYTNINTLIKNIRFEKVIQKNMVTYRLVSTYNDVNEDSAAYKNFFDELNATLSMWFLLNEKEWFFALVDKAEKIIQELQKG